MRTLVLTLGIAGFGCVATFASQEQLLPPYKVTITADAGKIFGEVSATLELAKDQKPRRIKSISLTIDKKTIAIPEDQFKDLLEPLIETAELRTEQGRDPAPWLYLTFQLAKPGVLSANDRPRVYIRYQNGKLMERIIQEPRP